MTTEVRCPEKDCQYNKCAICMKRVITLRRCHFKEGNLRCDDKKDKTLGW